MSLLLEALKKAERAKEEAQRQAGGEGLQLDPVAPAEARHVVTRDELPDISQPMDILSEDISPATRAPAAERRSPTQGAAARSTANRSVPADAASPDRSAAKKVFEAKFREPNPRLPFYIAMGCLGAFALGTGVYFWYELRPPPALVNANPPRAPAEPVAVIPPDAKAAPAAVTPPGAVPGLPETKPAPAPASATPVAVTAPAGPVAATPAPAPEVPAKPSAAVKPAAVPVVPGPGAERRVPVAPARQGREPIAIRRAAPAIDPSVESAYRAYGAGDMSGARAGYEQALRADPVNRDALLGLAAVELRAQNHAAAENLYTRLLRADPRDAHAQAGMIALRGHSADPVALESRVKTLLTTDPESGVLHFTLANQLAQQGRWAEAQQSYFRAVTAEPENPDFAYNLAVSLDHMRKPNLALEYYRKALALADKRGATFDRTAAQARAQQLAR